MGGHANNTGLPKFAGNGQKFIKVKRMQKRNAFSENTDK